MSAGRRPPTTAAARSPATRSRRSSARPRRPPSRSQRSGDDVDDRHRPDERHRLHVHGDGDQRDRRRGRRRRRRTPSRRSDTIFDFATPATHRLRRRRRRRAGREVHVRRQPARSPASASTRRPANTGTHVGSSVDADRHSCWPRPRSRTRPPRAGRQVHVLQPGRDHRRHDVRRRRTSRPSGHYSVHRRGLHLGRRQPAAARARQRRERRTACTRTAAATRSRASTFNAANYWVDVAVLADAASGPGRRT